MERKPFSVMNGGLGGGEINLIFCVIRHIKRRGKTPRVRSRGDSRRRLAAVIGGRQAATLDRGVLLGEHVQNFV